MKMSQIRCRRGRREFRLSKRTGTHFRHRRRRILDGRYNHVSDIWRGSSKPGLRRSSLREGNHRSRGGRRCGGTAVTERTVARNRREKILFAAERRAVRRVERRLAALFLGRRGVGEFRRRRVALVRRLVRRRKRLKLWTGTVTVIETKLNGIKLPIR